MGIDLVIFDNDGTLADSESLNNAAVATLLQRLGFEKYTLDYCVENMVGKTMNDIVYLVESEENTKLPDDFIERFVRIVCEESDKLLQPVKGAVEAVRELSEKYKICVGSNGERENVFVSQRSIGLFDFFTDERIFTAGQVARGKPYPDLFLYAAEKMGVSPHRSLVIEDSSTGVRAGVAAGMRVIGITAVAHNKPASAQFLKHAGAEQVFDQWPDIVDYIKTSCG